MVTVFFVVAVMVLVGAVMGVAVGRIGGGLDRPAGSLPARGVPAAPDGRTAPVTPGDLATVRFNPAWRGYRMSEVDDALDAAAAQLAAHEQRIAQLEALIDGAGSAQTMAIATGDQGEPMPYGAYDRAPWPTP